MLAKNAIGQTNTRPVLENEEEISRHYYILREAAANEASLRLRVSNLKLEADCAAIRAERDKAVRESEFERIRKLDTECIGCGWWFLVLGHTAEEFCEDVSLAKGEHNE